MKICPSWTKKHRQNKSEISYIYRKFLTYYVGQIALQVGPKNIHKISRKFSIYCISEISDLMCRTNCPPSRTKKHPQIKSEISDLLCRTNCPPSRTKKHPQNKSEISNIYRKFPTYYVGQIALQIGPKNTHKISRKFPIYIGNFRLIMSNKLPSKSDQKTLTK